MEAHPLETTVQQVLSEQHLKKHINKEDMDILSNTKTSCITLIVQMEMTIVKIMIIDGEFHTQKDMQLIQPV